MRTILCYGDSNTWGYQLSTGERFPADVRWTGVLKRELGEGYSILEEGLNGRTTIWDDLVYEHRNGKTYLLPCLESRRPLDLVIILLGLNDLKWRLARSASDIAEGAGVLVDLVQRSGTGSGGSAPQVLLLAPPPVGALTELREMFAGAKQASRQFPFHFGRIARERRCAFLDTSEVIVSSDRDGIHLEAGEQAKLGNAVALLVQQLCPPLLDGEKGAL